jgi:hypothetical protein
MTHDLVAEGFFMVRALVGEAERRVLLIPWGNRNSIIVPSSLPIPGEAWARS